MAFKSRIINGIGLWALAIATAFMQGSTLEQVVIDNPDVLAVPLGGLRTRAERSFGPRSSGSRHHRHFAKARASGRHDSRATL